MNNSATAKNCQIDIATKMPDTLKTFIDSNFGSLVAPVTIVIDPHWIENDGTHFKAYVKFEKHVTKSIYNSLIWTIAEYWGRHKEKNNLFD